MELKSQRRKPGGSRDGGQFDHGNLEGPLPRDGFPNPYRADPALTVAPVAPLCPAQATPLSAWDEGVSKAAASGRFSDEGLPPGSRDWKPVFEGPIDTGDERLSVKIFRFPADSNNAELWAADASYPHSYFRGHEEYAESFWEGESAPSEEALKEAFDEYLFNETERRAGC